MCAQNSINLLFFFFAFNLIFNVLCANSCGVGLPATVQAQVNASQQNGSKSGKCSCDVVFLYGCVLSILEIELEIC